MAASPYANDLTMATPALSTVAEWQTLDNSCGSKHLPVITSIHTEYSSSVTIPQPKWKLSKAKWDRFKNLCSDTLKTVESGSRDEVLRIWLKHMR